MCLNVGMNTGDFDHECKVIEQKIELSDNDKIVAMKYPNEWVEGSGVLWLNGWEYTTKYNIRYCPKLDIFEIALNSTEWDTK